MTKPYLVVCESVGDVTHTAQHDTLPEARKAAETFVLENGPYCQVAVYLRTHSVTVEPRAVWTEHAKGISGN